MKLCSNGLHDCVQLHKRPCPELRKEILELVSEGLPLIRALEIYLIDPFDFGQMRILAEAGDRELREFAQDCMKAEASFEITLIRTAIKNPTAASKLLENRFSSTWKNYTESDIESMSPAELQRFIDTQTKKNLLLDTLHTVSETKGKGYES